MPSLPVVLHSRCAPILCSPAIFYLYHTRLKPDVHIRMVGHLFQNYDTIYVRFFPRILAIIPATRYTCVFCHVYLRFIPKYMTIFLQTRIYMRTKKPIYMCYKQACGICGRRKSSYKGHRIIPSAKNPFMYGGAGK